MPSEFDERWSGVSIPEREWHFHSRLLERYEIVLQPGEYSRMLKLISADRAPIVERRKNGRVLALRRRFDNRLVFDAVCGVRPLTALPPTPTLWRKWVKLSKRLRQTGIQYHDYLI